jgi:DNA-binding PadR family transcriptional regulator
MALLDGPSYGTRIVEEIEAREGSSRKIYPANLFRRIRDLMEQGLIQDAPSPADADPRRSYLRLTRRGRAVARAEARRLRDLVVEAERHRLLSEK